MKTPALLALLALPFLPGPAFAVQEGAGDTGDEAAAPQEEAAPQVPTTVAEAIENADSLLDDAEALSDEDALKLLAAYSGLVTTQNAALESLLETAEGSPEREKETGVRADLQTLLSSTESLVKALAARGLEVENTRDKIKGLRESTASAEGDKASEMTRGEALDIDPEVLRAVLRPMMLEQVEAHLAEWLTLLQKTCVEISDVEKAALLSEGDEDGDRFNERAVLLRGERGRLIERVEIVIDALEKKGGEEKGVMARAYVSSVVATPPITGFRAAVTTSLTWLKSRDGGIAVAIEILTAVVILFLARLISGVLGRLARKAMGRVGRTSHLLQEFVVATIRRGTMFIGILVALSTLGVNMGPLLAAIGAAGLVVGLALQGTLGNLASGIMIMVFRPFDVDDIVDTAGSSGKVLGMNLMTTTVRTFDNRTIFVPNSMIWGDVITNVTANDTRRVDMVFGIGYADDQEKARQILEHILEKNDKVLADPEPLVRLHTLNDSSVDFIVRPWSKTSDYWDVYWEVTNAVKSEFDAQGISIPFPQRDVHLIPANGQPTGDHVLEPHAKPEPNETTSEEQQEVAS